MIYSRSTVALNLVVVYPDSAYCYLSLKLSLVWRCAMCIVGRDIQSGSHLALRNATSGFSDTVSCFIVVQTSFAFTRPGGSSSNCDRCVYVLKFWFMCHKGTLINGDQKKIGGIGRTPDTPTEV